MRGLAALAAVGIGAMAVAASGARAVATVGATQTKARDARVVSVREEGSLGYVSSEASSILDEGSLRGTLPGRGRVVFIYSGSPNVSARFTIRTAAGTISGSARCHLHNPTSLTPSFRGALAISGGSGRYAHARGEGELFGVFHRRGYGLVVQAIGRLRY
ncbi:MAG TPA: hypothetical protein VMS02_02100 [Solirubrobacteraceae bacterium]|nr:hypothetical protein [Solirubrobacteraceae bacterium]